MKLKRHNRTVNWTPFSTSKAHNTQKCMVDWSICMYVDGRIICIEFISLQVLCKADSCYQLLGEFNGNYWAMPRTARGRRQKDICENLQKSIEFRVLQRWWSNCTVHCRKGTGMLQRSQRWLDRLYEWNILQILAIPKRDWKQGSSKDIARIGYGRWAMRVSLLSNGALRQ